MALEQFSIVSGAVLGFCVGFITRDGKSCFETRDSTFINFLFQFLVLHHGEYHLAYSSFQAFFSRLGAASFRLHLAFWLPKDDSMMPSTPWQD